MVMGINDTTKKRGFEVVIILGDLWNLWDLE
jgi:hypothetical protein